MKKPFHSRPVEEFILGSLLLSVGTTSFCLSSYLSLIAVTVDILMFPFCGGALIRGGFVLFSLIFGLEPFDIFDFTLTLIIGMSVAGEG